MGHKLNYTIISTRKEGTVGKGDQVVLRQIRRVLELKDKTVEYVQIQLNLRKIFRRCSTSSVIYISALDLVWALMYIIFAGWPIQTAVFSNPRLARKLQRLTRCEETRVILSQERTHGFRIVQSDCLLLFIDALAHNLRTRKYKNLIFKGLVHIEARRLQSFAAKTPSNLVKMFVTDEEQKHYRLKNSVSIPNFLSKDEIISSNQSVSDDRKRIVLSGNFHYRPNFEAANWILENLEHIQSSTTVNFDLVFAGLGSDRYLGASSNLVCLTQIPIMRDVLRTCDCSIAPMQSGSGIQNKILEALGAGIPCIASTIAYTPFCSAYGVVKGVLTYKSVDDLIKQIDLVFSGDLRPNREELVTKLSLEENADWIYENLFKR